MDETENPKKYVNYETQGGNKLWNYYLDLVRKKSFIKDVNVLGLKYKDRFDRFYKIVGGSGYAEELHNLCLKYELDSLLWSDSVDAFIQEDKVEKPDVLASLCWVIDVI